MKDNTIVAATYGTIIGISLGLIIILVFSIPIFNYFINDLSKTHKSPTYETIREIEKRIENNINNKLKYRSCESSLAGHMAREGMLIESLRQHKIITDKESWEMKANSMQR